MEGVQVFPLDPYDYEKTMKSWIAKSGHAVPPPAFVPDKGSQFDVFSICSEGANLRVSEHQLPFLFVHYVYLLHFPNGLRHILKLQIINNRPTFRIWERDNTYHSMLPASLKHGIQWIHVNSRTTNQYSSPRLSSSDVDLRGPLNINLYSPLTLLEDFHEKFPGGIPPPAFELEQHQHAGQAGLIAPTQRDSTLSLLKLPWMPTHAVWILQHPKNPDIIVQLLEYEDKKGYSPWLGYHWYDTKELVVVDDVSVNAIGPANPDPDDQPRRSGRIRQNSSAKNPSLEARTPKSRGRSISAARKRDSVLQKTPTKRQKSHARTSSTTSLMRSPMGELNLDDSTGSIHFYLPSMKSIRVRPFSCCNTVTKLFQEAQTVANIGKPPTAKAKVVSTLRCRVRAESKKKWPEDGLLMVKGDEKDFEALLAQMQTVPASQNCIIEAQIIF